MFCGSLNKKRSLPVDFDQNEVLYLEPNQKIRKSSSSIVFNKDIASPSSQCQSEFKQKSQDSFLRSPCGLPALEKPVYPFIIRKFLNAKHKMKIDDAINQLETPTEKSYYKKLKQMRILRVLQDKEVGEQLALRQRYIIAEGNFLSLGAQSTEDYENSPLTELKKTIDPSMTMSLLESLNKENFGSNHKTIVKNLSEIQQQNSSVILQDYEQKISQDGYENIGEHLRAQVQEKEVSDLFNEIDYSSLECLAHFTETYSDKLDLGLQSKKQEYCDLQELGNQKFSSQKLETPTKENNKHFPIFSLSNFVREAKTDSSARQEVHKVNQIPTIPKDHLRYKSLANYQIELISALIGQSKTPSFRNFSKTQSTHSLIGHCSNSSFFCHNFNDNHMNQNATKTLQYRLALLRSAGFNSSTTGTSQLFQPKLITEEINTRDNMKDENSSVKEPNIEEKFKPINLQPDFHSYQGRTKDCIDDFFSHNTEEGSLSFSFKKLDDDILLP